MKKFYLVSAIIVFLLILVLVLPQIGGSCQFYLPLGTNTSCALALFQASGLGAVMGGLLAFFWKASGKSGSEGYDENEVTSGGQS